VVPELLLLSNSVSPGLGFLEHARTEIDGLLAGTRRRVLFVPWASGDPDSYAGTLSAALKPVSAEVTSAHRVPDLNAALDGTDLVFVGGGNTFRLLRALHDRGLVQAMAGRVAAGLPYIGSSAGTNVACPTLRTSNDMPIVEPGSFAAIGLIPFQINPHYLDPDPASTHQGETRPERIGQFLEENDVPVLGLREGSWLRVSGDCATVDGTTSGRLFGRGHEPRELPPGSDVSSLLATQPRFDTR
jgi:dipeptidase E